MTIFSLSLSASDRLEFRVSFVKPSEESQKGSSHVHVEKRHLSYVPPLTMQRVRRGTYTRSFLINVKLLTSIVWSVFDAVVAARSCTHVDGISSIVSAETAASLVTRSCSEANDPLTSADSSSPIAAAALAREEDPEWEQSQRLWKQVRPLSRPSFSLSLSLSVSLHQTTFTIASFNSMCSPKPIE